MKSLQGPGDPSLAFSSLFCTGVANCRDGSRIRLTFQAALMYLPAFSSAVCLTSLCGILMFFLRRRAEGIIGLLIYSPCLDQFFTMHNVQNIANNKRQILFNDFSVILKKSTKAVRQRHGVFHVTSALGMKQAYVGRCDLKSVGPKGPLPSPQHSSDFASDGIWVLSCS